MSENIKVCIRPRPLNDREADGGCGWRPDPAGNTVAMAQSTGAPTTYSFDYVADERAPTRNVYEAMARPIIRATLEGFNGTIFAYGQTSSGKTHTMKGSDAERGIIPLAVDDIFASIAASPEREFLLRVSYMEIYNEVIRDLLAEGPAANNLKIHENAERGVFVGDLTEDFVVSAQQVQATMDAGEARRSVGATNMNERSSRSHTVFRMVIESRERQGDGAVRVATLNLVDLAGSERISQTKSEGIRLKEGGHINKSLLTLGTVIGKLSEGRDQHIPYRDSKLTRILQPSLGGNARTAIICAVTLAAQHSEETHSTLKFANRARNIKNKAQINEIIDDETMLKRYRREIANLKKRLNENGDDPSTREEIESLRDRNRSMEEQLEHFKSKLSRMQDSILNSGAAAAAASASASALSLAGSSSSSTSADPVAKRNSRRETWCPQAGAASMFATFRSGGADAATSGDSGAQGFNLEVEKIKREKESLARQLDATVPEIQALRREKEELAAALADRSAAGDGAGAEPSDLERMARQINDLRDRLSAKAVLADTLQAMIDQSMAAHDELVEKNQELIGALDQTQEQLQERKEKLCTVEFELEEREEELRETRQLREADHATVAELERKLEDLARESGQTTEMSSEISRLRESKDELETTVASMTDVNNRMQSKIEEYERRIECYMEMEMDLQQQMFDRDLSKDQGDILKGKLQEATVTIATLREEVERKDFQIAELQKDNSEATTTLEASRTENLGLTEQLNSALEQAQSDLSRIESLEKEILTLQDSLDKAESEASSKARMDAENTSTAHRRETEQLQTDLQDARRQNALDAEEFRRHISAQAQELGTIQTRNAQLEREVETGRHSLHQARTELEEARNSLQALETQLHARNSSVQQLEVTEAALRKQVQQFQQRSDLDAQTIGKHSEKIKALTARADELQALEPQVETLRAEVESAVAARDLAQRDVLKLQHDLTQARKDARKVGSGQAQKEKDMQRRELEKARSKLDDVDSKYRNLIKEKHAMVSEKNGLEQEAKNLRKQVALLEKDRDKYKASDEKKTDVTRKLDLSTKKLDQVTAQFEALTEQHTETAAQLQTTTERADDLESRATTAEDEVQQLKTLLNDKEAAMGGYMDQIDSLQTQLGGQHEQIEGLEGELSEMRGAKDQLAGELCSAQEQHQEQLQTLQTQLEQMQTLLDEQRTAREEGDKASAALAEQLTEVHFQLEELTACKEQAENEASEAKTQCAELDSALEKAQEQVAALQVKCEAGEEAAVKLEVARERITELEELEGRSTELIRTLESGSNQANELVTDLRSAMAAKTEEVEALMAENGGLREWRDQANQLKLRVHELGTEMEQLHETHATAQQDLAKKLDEAVRERATMAQQLESASSAAADVGKLKDKMRGYRTEITQLRKTKTKLEGLLSNANACLGNEIAKRPALVDKENAVM